MKFSPDINHKFVMNWWKNFGHSTTDMSSTPLFVSKLHKSLAAIPFEMFKKNIFGEVLDPYQLPNGWNFKHLQKNGVLRFFEQVQYAEEIK